jgi:hypothetical protein
VLGQAQRSLPVDDAEHQLQVLSYARSPAALQLLGYASAAQRAAGVNAENGTDGNATVGGHWPRKRRIFVQGQVSSTLIVILLVRTQQSAQMPFAKDNDMVEALTSN